MQSDYEQNQEKIFQGWKEEFETCAFDNAADFLWIYVMQGCGCGSSDTYREDFWNMFEAIANRNDKTFELIYKDKYNELIAQMLDSRGLLEHGSSISGSWLSSIGKKLYDLLTSNPTSDAK